MFTTDPAVRFADEYKVTEEVWRGLWRRYKLLGYTIPELCEVFYIQVGRPIKRRKMDEWIFRGKIYMMIYDKIEMGVQAADSCIFGDLEQRLINELFRHVKAGDTHGIKSVA